MKKLIILSFSMFLTIITSAYSKDYNLGDLEKIGFQKDSQQFYQMIGAIDGWSGILGGDKIEIYFYENANKVNKAFFESEAANQFWKESCIKGNVGLISKGDNACKILETLK